MLYGRLHDWANAFLWHTYRNGIVFCSMDSLHGCICAAGTLRYPFNEHREKLKAENA